MTFALEVFSGNHWMVDTGPERPSAFLLAAQKDLDHFHHPVTGGSHSGCNMLCFLMLVK